MAGHLPFPGVYTQLKLPPKKSDGIFTTYFGGDVLKPSVPRNLPLATVSVTEQESK